MRYHGHITKRGSKWLRRITIEAAIHAVKRQGPLRRFYHKVERKKGRKAAKVATARKLLEWIYHILKDGKSSQEVERVVAAIGRGEPGNRSGSEQQADTLIGGLGLNDIVWLRSYEGMNRFQPAGT